MISSSDIVAILPCLPEHSSYVDCENMRPSVRNHDAMSRTPEHAMAPTRSVQRIAAQLQIAAQLVEAHGVRALGQPPAQLFAVHLPPAYRIAEHAERA